MMIMFKEQRLGVLNDSLLLSEAKSWDPRVRKYFQGVRFTERARATLDEVAAFLDGSHLGQRPEKVYWGPGLEMLNRVYGNTPKVRLPLWYHLHTSISEADSERIIAALQAGGYECIMTTGFFREMPPAVRDYIEQNYAKQSKSEVTIYLRKP